MFSRNWKSWLSLFTRKHGACVRRPARKHGFRPNLESLEGRWVPSATGSISGLAVQDLTGNGYAAGDPGMSKVTIWLFAEDHHGHEELAASQKTAADGSYAFNNLAAGTYDVVEDVPNGYVRTSPTTSSSYTVTLAAGQAVTGDDFANFKTLNTNAIRKISYTITDPTLGTYTVKDLQGHTHAGDTVTVNFTVAPGATATLSLVVYDAPSAKISRKTESQDVLVNLASGTFTAGAHSLTVQLPDNFYQVDFVDGSALTQFGPRGSNLFYGAQHRLLGRGSGGTQAFAPASLAGNVYLDSLGTGAYSSADSGVANVTVVLTGVNDLGQDIRLTTKTDAHGNYSFTGLRAGTYTIADQGSTLPPGDSNELSSSAGSLGGNLSTQGQVSNIVLGNGQSGINYDIPLHHQQVIIAG